MVIDSVSLAAVPLRDMNNIMDLCLRFLVDSKAISMCFLVGMSSYRS